jgi:hypothetical protein
MALTLAQDWTGKNGEVKAGLCGDPATECLRYSQRLFLFNPEMVSDPRQMQTLGKRGFSDYAMLVSFPRDIGQLLRGSTVASVSYISTYSG